MVYKLYFSDRVVIIDEDATGYDSAEVAFTAPGDPSIAKAKLLQKLQTTKRLVLIAADAEALFRSITGEFPYIEAGGGLVTNHRGEILMIFRHGRWDLPKGKLECSECIEECAAREVEEETGLSGVKLGPKLTVTTHFYRLNGDWVMKKTTWYAMTYEGTAEPVPQAEEDITGIEWVSPGKLDSYLRSTYSTFVDVFEAAGYRIR